MNLATASGSSLPPRLARFVDHIQVMRPEPGRELQQVERLPNGTTTLLLRITRGAVGSSLALGSSDGDLSISGPRTTALYKRVPSIPLSIQVRIKPGGNYPLLGVPEGEITDQVVHLEEIWGTEGRQLRDRLISSPSAAEMLDLLQQALLERAQRFIEPPTAQLVRRAVRVIRERDTVARIVDLADALGVSQRHLRRAFVEMVGVGPKEFTRMARLERAIHAFASETSLTKVAADSGYYDQSHMNADFRDLVGMAPGVFVRRAEGPLIRQTEACASV